MSKYFESVKQFNTLAGSLDNVTQQSLILQTSFIWEEFANEMIEAFEEGDAVEFLDGVADTYVTACGLLQMLGRDWYLRDLIPIKITNKADTDCYISEMFMKLEMIVETVNKEFTETSTESIYYYLSEFIYRLEVIMNYLACELKVDIGGVLDAVNENNLSKFPTIESGYVEIREGMTRSVRDGFIIIKNEAGKVQKPTTFVSVDLVPFVTKELEEFLK